MPIIKNSILPITINKLFLLLLQIEIAALLFQCSGQFVLIEDCNTQILLLSTAKTPV
jgi:hypothetical protein